MSYYCSTGGLTPSARLGRGFTLVELLVVIAIIGVLIALLLPAVQASREAARRTACQNNLRQVGLALLNHESRAGAFPTGCVGCKPSIPAPGEPRKPPLLRSWGVELLPTLERQDLFDQFDVTKPMYDAANRQAISAVLPELLCPSTDNALLHVEKGLFQGAGFTDYGGVYGVEGVGNAAPFTARQLLADPYLGVMLYEEPTAMRTITDGASHTAAFAELLHRRVSDTEWANGHNVFAQENNTPINGDSQLGNSIGAPHPGGALLAFCDGHIEFIEDFLEQPVLNALLTRAGGE